MPKQSLSSKVEALLEDLKGYHPEKIILFGSSVRGDSDSYSDLDVVIIKKTNKPFLERLVEAGRFVRAEVLPLDIFVYTPEEFERMRREENPFIERAITEGKIIYEKC